MRRPGILILPQPTGDDGGEIIVEVVQRRVSEERVTLIEHGPAGGGADRVPETTGRHTATRSTCGVLQAGVSARRPPRGLRTHSKGEQTGRCTRSSTTISLAISRLWRVSIISL